MIGKVIPAPQTGSSFQRLNAYILSDKPGDPDHKVSYSDVINLTAIETATAEMEMLAYQNKRCKNPVFHCLLSWKAAEQPSEEQVYRAVEITLSELGLSDCQTLYALHQNTENYHVHISINRISPETHKAIDPAHGWTIKALERSARRIEYEQGWEVENNAWTRIDEQGHVIDESIRSSLKDKSIPQRMKDFENITGEKSAIRYAQEQIKPIMNRLKSWDDLHEKLRNIGMEYNIKGSGAIITVGDTVIKASSVSKDFSLNSLEKRLGSFVKQREKLSNPEMNNGNIIRQPVQGIVNRAEWNNYAEARGIYYQEKKKIRVELTKLLIKEGNELKEKHKQERATMNKQDWRGRGKELNIARSVLAVKQKMERLNLYDQHNSKRKYLQMKLPKFTSYEEWLRSKILNIDAEKWRHRARYMDDKIFFTSINEGTNNKFQDIRGYSANIARNGVVFRSKSNPNYVAFIDTGRRISVKHNDDSALLAAMQLAQQKWGSIQLNGSDEYIKKCLILAIQNDIRVMNIELQPEIKSLENNLINKGINAVNMDKKLELFLKYHAAIGADRYTITATEIFEDGTKRGFLVNKKDGCPDGFTSQELQGKMRRLSALEKQGRNIYYTPISENQHHILIDDMDNESLAKLLADGYQPSAIIQSSPGNWQAVLTIDKLATEIDRAIGNAIVSKLNKEYGDPNVSGEIHAHRAPGFMNRKQKHKMDDGSYPEVELSQTNAGRCSKTQLLAKEIYEEISGLREEEKKRLQELENLLLPGDNQSDTIHAYKTHLDDVLNIQERQGIERTSVDVSRIDAMICIRLRATGHSKEDIEKALFVMAPKVRDYVGSTGSHEWADYAKRTADYAFGFSGDIALQKRSGFIQHWKRIEFDDCKTKNQPRDIGLGR